MADLPKGYTIQTKNFKKVAVGDKLGEGGQGSVYRVDYDGKPKALKWYTGKKSNLRKSFTLISFNKEVMSNPSSRIIEQEWLRTFIRMRSEIYKCPCGEVYFADPVNPNACPSCGKKNVFPIYIKTSRYNLPVHQRTKLYACHTDEEVMAVMEEPPDIKRPKAEPDETEVSSDINRKEKNIDRI